MVCARTVSTWRLTAFLFNHTRSRSCDAATWTNAARVRIRWGLGAGARHVELRRRGLNAEREAILRIEYKGDLIPSFYRADFVVDGVVLELKAKSDLAPEDEAQVINYLRATDHRVGLLLNFGEGRLVARRLVHRYEPPSAFSAPSA